MAGKFSSTRPGVAQQDTSRVEDVPLIEGATIPLPSEDVPSAMPDPYAAFGQMAAEEAAQSQAQAFAAELSQEYDQAVQEEQQAPSAPQVDEVIFDQRLMKAAGLTPEQQVQSTQAITQGLQRPAYDVTSGLPIEDPAKKVSIMAKEQREVNEAMRRKGNIDYTNYQEMSRNFDNIVHESDLGTIQNVAKDATLNLNKLGSSKGDVSETGINALTNMFETNNKEVIGGFVNATSAVAMEVMSGRINQDIQNQITEDTAVDVQDPNDLFAGMSSAEMSANIQDDVDLTNGMKASNFNSRLAAAYKTYMKNQKLSNKEDPSIAQRANSDVLGVMLKDAVIEGGLFKELKGNDGELYIIPTKKVKEFAGATQSLVKETIAERKVIRRPKTPANANTGFYNQWSRSKDVRNRYIPRYKNTSLESKYKSPNKEKGSLQDITDFAVRVGSVPYSTTNYQVGGLALITALAFDPENPYASELKKFLSLDDDRMNNIAKEAGGGERGAKAAAQENAKTVNKLNNSVYDYSNITISGVEYNYHKTDPSVWRWYPENLSVEMQNNLYNRALGANPVATPMKVTSEDIRAISSMGEASKKYFLKHFKDGGPIKDRRQAIISNLLAAHKNIVGKASEELTWEERVGQLTPQFISQHGNTGRLLKSAINKLNLVNNNGQINIEALSKYALTFDRQSGKAVSNAAVPQLSADEMSAIAAWIGASDKKTFGFTLTSFIAMSDLIEAVQNGTYWNPKITTDMDMNSAGRTFLAMDIGDDDVLSRTGVLFNAVDRLKGGPRKLFYLQMNKLIDNRYNDYNINKLFKNSNATNDAERKAIAAIMEKEFKILADQYPEFYDDLAKKVLLKDDYGKHFSFHHEDARGFLFKGKYNSLMSSLMPHYNSEQDLVKDFANLYAQTILSNSELWNKEAPKDMVEYLQFFNRFPEPELYFSEKASIGSESYREVPDGESTFVTTASGQVIEIKQKEKVIDPTKRAKSKRIYDADTDTYRHFDADYNTYNQNIVGPISGQYRESATLILAVNMVNPDKLKTPHWFAIVHDNLIVDGNGFAPYYFGVNAVKGGSARKIFGFDFMGEFVQDFRRQYDDIINEMKKEIASKGRDGAFLDIGTEGENAAIGRRADTVYNRLKSMEEDVYTRKFLEAELDLYKNIGWRNPDERAGDLKSYPIKLENILKKVHKPIRRNKFTGKEETAQNPMNFIEAWFYIRNLNEKMNQFILPDGSYAKDTAFSKKQKKLAEVDTQEYVNIFS